MNEREKRFLMAAAEIRKLTIQAMAAAGYGHIGGCMSVCDLLAVLYEEILNVDPRDPHKRDRDYVVMSKGHCGPALYAALAYRGYFDRELLLTLNANGTSLPSHCDRLKTPGIDFSTGSLGQGVSLGIGAALGNRMQGLDSYTYIITGDGELQEGQVWEGVQFMAHHGVANAVLIVDNNGRQLDGYTAEICRQYDLAAKFAAFGLTVFRADGHKPMDIYRALTAAKRCRKPSAVILDTEKGRGCCFAEIPGFNHYMVITPAMAQEAIREIDRRLERALCGA